jgi:hypothetical protein
MHRNTPDMAVFYRLRQVLDGEIFSALPGIKRATAQINSIGTILHRSPQGIHGTGRRQQFDHTKSPQGILKNIIT